MRHLIHDVCNKQQLVNAATSQPRVLDYLRGQGPRLVLFTSASKWPGPVHARGRCLLLVEWIFVDGS